MIATIQKESCLKKTIILKITLVLKMAITLFGRLLIVFFKCWEREYWWGVILTWGKLWWCYELLSNKRLIHGETEWFWIIRIKKESKYWKGWLAIAKLIPISLFISLLLMPNKAFENVKIEKEKWKCLALLQRTRKHGRRNSVCCSTHKLTIWWINKYKKYTICILKHHCIYMPK